MNLRFYTTLALVVIISHSLLLAQKRTYKWGHQVSGNGNKYIASAAFDKDSSNNIYFGGNFSNTVNFNPSGTNYVLTASSTKNGFISRVNSDGSFDWVVRIAGSGASDVYDVVVGDDQMLYITGSFNGTVDLNPDSVATQFETSNGGSDIFFMKLNPGGELVWAKTYGSTTSDYGYRICTSSGNQLILAGKFNGNITWKGGTSPISSNSSGYSDIFLVKSDTAGDVIWAKTFAPTNSSTVLDVETNESGDIYFTGGFRGTVDMNPDPNVDSILTAHANGNVFLGALNDSGSYLFSFVLQGDYYSGSAGYCILVQNQSIYLAGSCKGWLDFDPSSVIDSASASGGLNEDMFVARYSLSGGLLGYGVIGGNNSDLTRKICSDKSGAIYGVGSMVNTVDFDPDTGVYNLSSTGSMNISGHVFKWDSTLKFKWASRIPSSTYSSLFGIETDEKEDLYMFSSFIGTANFDPSPDTAFFTSAGTDILITKWEQCQTFYSYDTVSSCTHYSWRGLVLDSSNTYLDTLITADGCDSILVLNLTIFPKYYSTSIQACDSFNWNGVWLTSTGSFMDTLISTQTCDSIITLNLSLSATVTNYQHLAGCDSVYYKGSYYDSSQSISDTLIGHLGCDSIVITNLTVNASVMTSVNIDACDSFVYQSNTYYQNQILYDSLQNQSGCDSLVIIDLVVHSSNLESVVIEACDSFAYKSNTYYQSQVLYDSLQNQFGCDSLVIIDLTVNTSSSALIVIDACDSIVYKSHTYYQNQVLYDSLQKQSGCDSIIVTQLNVYSHITQAEQVWACRNYSWHNQILTQSGVYYDSLFASHGCDSVFELTLVIEDIADSIILSSNTLQAYQSGLDYQWLDCNNGHVAIPGAIGQNFTPNQTGNYAVELSGQACIDTSECMFYIQVGLNHFQQKGQPILLGNPGSGVIRSRPKLSSFAYLEVFNASGTPVTQKVRLIDDELNLPQSLPSGLYFIVITSKEGEKWYLSYVKVP